MYFSGDIWYEDIFVTPLYKTSTVSKYQKYKNKIVVACLLSIISSAFSGSYVVLCDFY